MGLFDSLKKESYINRLVKSYRSVYGCGNFAAVECLRANYTLEELKDIYNAFLKEDKAGPLSMRLLPLQPFFEDPAVVKAIDARYGGR